jgi:DNA primase
MANRIPQSFIDDLLTRIDIVSVIEPLVKLKKAGANYVACCPFHQEKTPSFTVSSSKQIYHCFGCGVGGNAISFLMDYENLSFIDTIETLANMAGLEIPQQQTTSQQSSKESADFYTVLKKSANFYKKQLSQHPQAKNATDWLKKRGLNQEIIERFNIGYAPPGWDNLTNIINNTKYQKLLLTTGMLIQKPETSSIYDRFRNRIMFPITDRRGRVIGFGGRVINDDDTPKYLNSPETPVFHKGHELYGLYEARQANRNLKCLLLVEGYMDVVMLAQHGISYAVATLGTATTINHVQKLFRASSEVIFCFDGDEAGRLAAWRTLEILLPLLRDDWQAKFIFLPDGEDPDSLIQKIGQSAFEKLIQNANPLSTFFFDHLSKQVDLQQIDGRTRLAQQAMSYVQQMPQNMRKEIMIETLAQQINMPAEKLYNYLTSQKQAPVKSNIKQVQTAPSPIRIAITLLIQNPSLINHLDQELPTLDAPGMSILHELCSLLQTKPKLTTGAILEHWRDKPEYKHLYQLSNYEHLLKDQNLTHEFCGAIDKIHAHATENAINQLISKANGAGLTNTEKKQLQKLLKESKIEN